MIKERERSVLSGWGMLAVLLVILAGAILWIILVLPEVRKVWGAVVMVIDFGMLAGLFMVNPNEGRVLQLFGKYVGTAKQEGLRWANPLYAKRRISLRVRNFETNRLKVNDIDGNPIEIGAIVVWRVVDTAEACFQVDQCEQFVAIQSEAAIRNLATQHPYDSHSEERVSLRGHTATISDQLREGDPSASGTSRCRGDRGTHQPSGVCPRDRRGDASSSAGGSGNCREDVDRRGCGRDGRDGAAAVIGEEDH